MIQIRCTEPINGYTLNQIINVPDDGLSFALRGKVGGLIIKDLGEGNKILFQVDDAIDQIDDKIRVQAPDSLHNYFTFDITIVEPNDPLPPEALNCSLMNLLSPLPPTFIYIPETNEVEWTLVPASPSIVLEKATEPNDITKAGSSIVNITYRSMTKDANGNYKVRTRNSGNVETILLRQVGCTSSNINTATNDFFGGRFHTYIPSGTVVPDPGPYPNPTPEGKVPGLVAAFRWDGYYDDYGLTPRSGIGGSPYDQGINDTSKIRHDLTVFSNANVVPFFGQQNLTPESIPIITQKVWNPVTEQNDLTIVEKNVTCKFDLTPTAVEKEIGYAQDAGIDFWVFLWFSPYDTPMAEGMHKFVMLPNKNGMKMSVRCGGSFGWNIGNSVEYIAQNMMQDFWQRIEGKPLLMVESNFQFTAQIQARYGELSGGGEPYIVTMGGFNDYPQTPHHASTVYITAASSDNVPSNELPELPHYHITNLEVQKRNEFMNNPSNNNTKIVPCLTTGVLNYPVRNNYGDWPDLPYWNAAATSSDWDSKFSQLIGFMNSHPNRVPFIIFYSWNENHESGNPICPTLASGTSSVNVATINTAGATAGVNRSTLDKVKQWCKK